MFLEHLKCFSAPVGMEKLYYMNIILCIPTVIPFLFVLIVRYDKSHYYYYDSNKDIDSKSVQFRCSNNFCLVKTLCIYYSCVIVFVNLNQDNSGFVFKLIILYIYIYIKVCFYLALCSLLFMWIFCNIIFNWFSIGTNDGS